MKLASRYVRGQGIEVGALHRPLKLPSHVRVRYVDRLTTIELRRHYPELKSESVVPVDIVEDGEALSSISDGSLDFVVANHMIEHCENPIGALSNWLRVVRAGGVTYVAVPDKRFTFDHSRPITSIEHVLRDWREGPEWSRLDHYEEYARLVDGTDPTAARRRAHELTRERRSIHFHVWDTKAFREFLAVCRLEIAVPFEVRELVRNGNETIVILERCNSNRS